MRSPVSFYGVSRNKFGSVPARLKRLRQGSVRAAQGLLVTHLPSVRYLSGFTGSFGVLAVTPGDCSFFTAELYRTQARQEVKGAQVRITGSDALGAAARWMIRQGVQLILYEENRMKVSELLHLEKVAGADRLRPVTGRVEKLRMVKDR